MGFFDGFGRYMRPRHRRRGLHLGDEGGMLEVQAEADATRISFMTPVDERVSRIPPADAPAEESGPTRHAKPATKPDPRAQWDGVAGRWIIWDQALGDWVPAD